MAIEKLQEKIRKKKNPSMVDFSLDISAVPPCVMELECGSVYAFERFARELLFALKDIVPAVRFGMASYTMLGPDGLMMLSRLCAYAGELDYYVLLDVPESFSAQRAENFASTLFADSCPYYFDGILLSAYAGSDVLKPYVKLLKAFEKDLFVVLRTANKSAPELQDLLTGSRLVHMAAADVVNRLAQPLIGRSGYSQVAVVGPASVADILKKLRARYTNLFLLLDGYDYTNANAKNCSFAFDRLGHGAIACADRGVLAAWNTDSSDGTQYVQQAVEAAERMKKNLLRYVNVL